jgi:hypothetical protein
VARLAARLKDQQFSAVKALLFGSHREIVFKIGHSAKPQQDKISAGFCRLSFEKLPDPNHM